MLQRTRLTDHATIHQCHYDLLGRQTADRVSQVGLGIDDAVRCLGLSYEVRGMVKNVTSYSTPAVDEDFVVNDVRNDYRDFLQNAGQDQEHNGKVVLGTTLRTIYDYIDGTGNTARFKRYSLPNELGTFSYNYGDVDGIGDRLSRPIGTSAQYGFQYLGLSSLLETRIYRGQAIRWSVILGSDAANPYGGLDRFGRVIDNLWNLPDLSTTLDRIQYGYDRVGNRVWRYNLVAHSNSAVSARPHVVASFRELRRARLGSDSLVGEKLSATIATGAGGNRNRDGNQLTAMRTDKERKIAVGWPHPHSTTPAHWNAEHCPDGRELQARVAGNGAHGPAGY